MMNYEATVDVFENRTVAGRVGNGQMKRRFSPIGEVGIIDAKGLLAQFGHCLVDGSEIVEYILRPDAQSHNRPRIAGTEIIRFSQKQQICHQAALINPVADAYIIPRCHHAAIQ